MIDNFNRIKCLRKLKGLSQANFAAKYNVAQTAVSNWEQFRNSIDISTASRIAEEYKVPVEFVYGFDFEITRPVKDWTHDQIEDMTNAHPSCKDFFLFRYGRGYFANTHQNNEKPTAINDDEPIEENVIVFHRDGKNQRRKFSKDQMAMLMAMVDAIPESDDED